MAEKISIQGLHGRARRFLEADTVDKMARILKKEPLTLAALAALPPYHCFFIPKKNGGRRHIENPGSPLKKIQRNLNNFLQAVYYFHRTGSAYGFLLNPTDEPRPRHILSNAEAHVGCQWLLNMDMKDFFHTIPQSRVEELFEAPLFGFGEQLSRLLAGLACFHGRLPMGAPTSPVISNLVSIPMDEDLQHLADRRGWMYTRYADDMSFSSKNEPITEEAVEEITHWVQLYGFEVNPEKCILYTPDRVDKEVTGLWVGATEVGLAPDYTTQLEGAIEHLGGVVAAQFLTPSGKNQASPWVRELEQMVRGKLEFARQILGAYDEVYLRLEEQFEHAMEPPEEYGPLSWLEFGYETPR